MKTAKRFASLLLFIASGCTRVLIGCPEGMVPAGDHCIAADPSVPRAVGPESDEPDEGLPPRHDENPSHKEGCDTDDAANAGICASNDAGRDAGELEVDASGEGGATPLDAQVTDSGLDALVGASDGSVDAGQLDAAPADVTSIPDAAEDTGDGAEPNEAAVDGSSPPAICEGADLANWRAFQVSGQLIPTIAACYARDPGCAVGPCDLAACLREAAGASSCSACVAEETRCMLASCVSSCASSDTSDACRACACRQGCIGATAACGMGSVNVCADCNGTTCTNVSLDPALIMVIVDATL